MNGYGSGGYPGYGGYGSSLAGSVPFALMNTLGNNGSLAGNILPVFQQLHGTWYLTLLQRYAQFRAWCWKADYCTVSVTDSQWRRVSPVSALHLRAEEDFYTAWAITLAVAAAADFSAPPRQWDISATTASATASPVLRTDLEAVCTDLVAAPCAAADTSSADTTDKSIRVPPQRLLLQMFLAMQPPSQSNRRNQPDPAFYLSDQLP